MKPKFLLLLFILLINCNQDKLIDFDVKKIKIKEYRIINERDSIREKIIYNKDSIKYFIELMNNGNLVSMNKVYRPIRISFNDTFIIRGSENYKWFITKKGYYNINPNNELKKYIGNLFY